MTRPYITCHMVTSIDGKVTGDFLFRPECEAATEKYYEINRALESDGFICGRVTMEGSFTGGWYPDLSSYAPVEDTTDYIAPYEKKFFAVAFDTNGKLGWKESVIVDEDPGYGGAHIIEVISENADKRYLAYLREIGVSYVFAGKEAIDVNVALEKLATLFDIKHLLLEGGSIINGAFERVGAVDELSLVVAPIIADKDDKPLFMDATSKNFKLISTETTDGSVWMRYKVKNKEIKQ